MSDASADDRDFLAIKESEIFEEARDRLKIAEDSESEDRSEAKDDLLFREGDQWPTKSVTTASQETPELTINLTDALAQRIINNMKQQRPRGKCHPVGDGATIEIAELINGIGRHIEYRSEAGVAYDTGGEAAVTMGWGYWRMLAEYVAPDSWEQDIRIVPIRNTFSVYMDPGALMPTACDAKWALITVQMARAEYKRRYPRAVNSAWAGGDNDQWRANWEDREHVRLAEYFRLRERPAKLVLLQDAQGNESSRYLKELPSPEAIAAAGLKIIDQRDSFTQQLEWFLLNGTKVVDRKLMPGEYIPIIRCEGKCTDVDGRVRRRGMVRSMKDPQRMLNYGEVAKVKRLGLTPQSPWIVAEGQLDGHPEWDSAGREPYSVLTWKPITVTTGDGETLLPPPQRIQPAGVESGFVEFTNQMRSNLLAVAGMPNDPGQDTQGQVVSGVAQKRRQGLSDQSHFQYYDNQTLAIAHTWRIMLSWIPKYYSESRMQRIIGEDGRPSMTAINQKDPASGAVKNDISVGRYDVVMDTGPGYETRREEGSEAMLSLMSIPQLAEKVVQIGADLILRSIDHPYMEELADRISSQSEEGLEEIMKDLPQRAQQIVKALSNQLKAVTQKLQQTESDLKMGLTKQHLIETTKAHDIEEDNKTRRHDTQVRAETERFKTLVQSHTQTGVAEIQEGASLMNTHVEAKYHEAEAERMIQTAEKAEGAK